MPWPRNLLIPTSLTTSQPQETSGAGGPHEPMYNRFSQPVKKAFLEKMHARVNKALFWQPQTFLEQRDPRRAKRSGLWNKGRRKRFIEWHDALTHFLLKDNQLYRRPLKEGQLQRKVVYDYDATHVIEIMTARTNEAGVTARMKGNGSIGEDE